MPAPGQPADGGKNAKNCSSRAAGPVKFVHGVGGKDTFVGGNKTDTMIGAGKQKGTDLSQFESTLKGGVHTIQSFTSGKDTIQLVAQAHRQSPPH